MLAQLVFKNIDDTYLIQEIYLTQIVHKTGIDSIHFAKCI